ncbi:ATP-dependent helicase [Corynebacterium propinquum]|uniref:DNA 3'-5' helicase n=1 Tax=Corynebacterium propinquum TaxID=43769 RepID=A0AAP4BW00_9CORY|nr:ATP-dependent helicase [Corynebacterium propinquum]MDK4326361.1 ATP-dependent helicase [Corynebacterium propinquum]
MIQPAEWRPSDGVMLEPHALTAVTSTEQNIVVMAGPGAGKTELLAQRADFLLRTGACPYPRRILAISFKVDAARNLHERVRRRAGNQLAAHFDSFTFHAFAKRIIDNYRLALTGQSELAPDYLLHAEKRIPDKQITYDDLLKLALEILKSNHHARTAVRQTYSHVFLDEFQDATASQYELLKTLFDGSGTFLTAVGDIKQKIMGWAGALDGIFQTFADDFSAISLPLYQNFRSSSRLRRMQNRMIAELDPAAIIPDQDLIGDDGVVEVRDFDTDSEEAKALAKRIQSWLDEGVEPSDVAVLVRQHVKYYTKQLSEELAKRGIPFHNEQDSGGLDSEPAAVLVFSFLRVIADDGQAEAYDELMRLSNRSDLSNEEGLRFDRQLKNLLQKARQHVQDSEVDRTETHFWDVWVEKFLSLVSWPKLVDLSPNYQQDQRLDEVIDQALDTFKRELSNCGDAVLALKHLSGKEAVRFLTIHKCKGLEFDKVVILGVEKEMFWVEPQQAIAEYFVAVSRAKTHLVLTWTRFRQRPAGNRKRWDANRNQHEKFINFARGD